MDVLTVPIPNGNGLPTPAPHRCADLQPRPAPGSARVAVDQVEGLSSLTHLSCTTPLKVLIPKHRGPSVWAYLSSYGGGIVAGDQTSLDLSISAHARLYLGTQSSTKVYRHDDREQSAHVTTATLGESALLVTAPEPVQAFAGSSYRQTQDFHIAPSSGLVLLDWFTSGRVACGEFWQMRKLEMRNRVWIDSRCVVHDALCLDRDSGETPIAERFGSVHLSGTMLFAGSLASPTAASFRGRIENSNGFRRGASLVWSVAEIAPDVTMVRFAGETYEEVAQWLKPVFHDLAPELGDDPWLRRT